ncbi:MULTISPECIES: DUF3710 domain-containing protein [Nonomuraea]|uniref:DUF3710 domain-containing protein n=1 Tax=Nonomuraea ferruginea TaxID=46174 RepID=A0ABT4SU62_9ACTN|nr:DUF3710 domain-containing protein [Nonomuraea ferruginea]MDA0640798.1 DUF3710 domain-containing protein [Nonomuraea ferruginea]
MFRRRRREQQEQVAEATAQAPTRESGPWDADEPHPDTERIDLGGLRLPHNPAFDVRLASVGDQHVGVVVLWEESSLQLQALAAPKSSGLWEEVRAKIKNAAKTLEEREGPFGAELVGKVTVEGSDRAARYMGVDGSRWFLLAVVNGRAAVDDELAAAFVDFIKDIVVVRGDEPMAREESIPLRRPNDQAAAEQPEVRENPFRRGPEISEIR